MKAFLAAVMAVALMTAPAYAQGMSKGKGGGHHRDQTADAPKKSDDKGYNAALAKMPDQKFDPWRTVRPEGNAQGQTGR